MPVSIQLFSGTHCKNEVVISMAGKWRSPHKYSEGHYTCHRYHYIGSDIHYFVFTVWGDAFAGAGVPSPGCTWGD